MNDSKTRLLETALKLFATKGVDGVSTREIAKEAKVNISAITYYFLGKEALYSAVLEYIKSILIKDAERIIQVLSSNKNIDDMTQQEARDIFMSAYDKVLDTAFVPKNIYIAMILAKESVQPSEIAIKVFSEKMFPLMQKFTKLTAKITNKPVDDKKTIILTETLLNQATLFGQHKKRILLILGIKKYDDEIKLLIKKMVLKQVEIILDYYIKEEK